MFELDRYADNTVAVTPDGRSATYGELDCVGHQIAAAIPVRGLVFNLCGNNLESLAGYVGFLNGGIPQVLLDSTKSREVLQRLIMVYGPAYIWVPASRASEFIGTELFRYGSYSLLKTSDSQMEINPELALCLTTSGSTGSPKLVRLSKRNLIANAESIISYLHISSSERPVTSLPMYYSYGLSVINSHLMCGATLLLTEATVMQREFWEFVRREKATSLAGVPYTYEMLRKLRFHRMDLPFLKTLTQAGGKLNPAIVREFVEECHKAERRFIVMYGQTEATARMSYTPQEKALEKCSSIGIPIPGGRFELSGPDGTTITAPSVEGELVYHGENVSLGYAETPADLAKGDENLGTLHTGDLAMTDEDGYYYITGRMSRFVKVWGNRCNLDATEQIVKSIVSDCACVGVDDRITVFMLDGNRADDVRQTLVSTTGFNSRAFDIRAVPSIPKSPAGKTLYAELQKLISAQ